MKFKEGDYAYFYRESRKQNFNGLGYNRKECAVYGKVFRLFKDYCLFEDIHQGTYFHAHLHELRTADEQKLLEALSAVGNHP